jgi:hypothetical protein
VPSDPATTSPPVSRPPEWPKWTDLVANEDGHYTHSNQIPEIQACLSSTVRRANSKLVFVNGFPDPKTKSGWLSSALKTELNERQAESLIIRDVNARAECDEQYFRKLHSMVSSTCDIVYTRILTLLFQIKGRWSGFRQGIIDMVRLLITSPESTYGLWRADNEGSSSDAASNLLTDDAYHFGRTPTVSPVTGCRIH